MDLTGYTSGVVMHSEDLNLNQNREKSFDVPTYTKLRVRDSNPRLPANDADTLPTAPTRDNK